MPEAGTHQLGPDRAKLEVRTLREGAAAKLGHDLVLEATRWQASYETAEDGSVTSAEATVDPNSLRVEEGTGGAKSLSDKDKAEIKTQLEKKVLQGNPISFRSTDIKGASIRGDLELGGTTRPITFVVSLDGGAPATSVELTQSDWGIKPYSAMLGALKVRDTVTVKLIPR